MGITTRARASAAGLVLGLGAAALAWMPAGAQARRALIAGGDSPGLFLIHTGEVIGYLDPCG